MKMNKKTSIILIIYIISISLLCLINFKMEPDYLWHIKAGEYMFKNGILNHDVFSWSMNGKYWMSHEWLFEVFIYLLRIVFGKAHLFIYTFSCTATLMFTIYLTNKKNIMKNLTFSILWLSLFLLCMFFVQVRPHMLSFIFLAITIYFLYDLYKNENSKKIFFLPILSILWANVHGGSSNLPYLLCLLFIIGGLFKFKFGKIEASRLSKKQFIKYIVVMLLCMACVCINVHGFKMFIYPYQNMMDKIMIENISEWKSTSLNNLSDYLYILYVLLIVIVFLVSKKKFELIDILLFGLCVFLGLKSVRFWFYTYIIMSYVIFNYVGKYEDDNKILNIGLICFSIVFIVCFCINVKKFINIDYSYELKQKDIEFIKKEQPKRLFNMYNYGGDLIYNDVKVFIDGRADLYSGELFEDYIELANLDGDFYSIMCKYGFDYYLVDKNSYLDYYLRYNDKFNLIYMNKGVKVYKKMN